MKVEDLLEFNPKAELGFIDSNNVFKPLEIYGWGGGDGCDKNSCKNVTLQLKDDSVETEHEEDIVIPIPNDMNDVFRILDEYVSDEDKEYILSSHPIVLHFTFGMWIRNNFGLWEEETNLKKELISLGITHPDDMSNYIIEEYIKYLKNDKKENKQ